MHTISLYLRFALYTKQSYMTGVYHGFVFVIATQMLFNMVVKMLIKRKRAMLKPVLASR